MLDGYSRPAFIKGKKWSFKSWKGPFIWVRWSTCAQNQKRALPLTRPLSLSFRSLRRHRHRPFHSNISFSSPGFVLGESNAANQRDDNIFHQLEDPGQGPSSFGKNQGRLFILSLRTCGPTFKVYKPVPININYSQTTQRLKQSRLKSVYGH